MRKKTLLITLGLFLIMCSQAIIVHAETKFEVDISKGLIPGHIAVFDVGHNENVGTTEEDIWSGPTISIPWLTVATRLNVTSSDVDDTLPAKDYTFKVRTQFEQYVNYRPVRNWKGVTALLN